ncbi:HNH endonuclease signature motif containing protein, partial [Nocardia alni]|uniref:HNH endonuclease signature motif containing protein n=1 Tax=Nocardia alni TaxID=2815723 RepID=UPI001C24CF2A
MHSISDVLSDPSAEAAVTALEAALAQVSKIRADGLSNADRLAMLERVETMQCALPSIGLELTAQLDRNWSTNDHTAGPLAQVLADRLHITPAEARARTRAADDLAHRTTLLGDALPPLFPATAAALADGAIGAAHVKIVRDACHRLPRAIDTATRTQAEAQLAGFARDMRPDQLRKVADKLEAILNPDGIFTDTDRARRRSLSLGPQGPDLMSPIKGMLDPETRAYMEAIFAKYAKPGVLNPDDATPATDPDATDASADVGPDLEAQYRDPRSPTQRQHDALKAVLRDTLSSGRLGQHRGLPVTVIVSMSLQELENAVAQADTNAPTIDTPRRRIGAADLSGPPVATAGGALLPIRDALRLAGHAHHYLALFDHHDGRPLYLARTKRIATADQRIILHARDIGCTFPGCAKPGYLCETHHSIEWAQGGSTDADQLTFACPTHHRIAGTTPRHWT